MVLSLPAGWAGRSHECPVSRLPGGFLDGSNARCEKWIGHIGHNQAQHTTAIPFKDARLIRHVTNPLNCSSDFRSTSGDTRRVPFTTRETDMTPTPASLATSASVGISTMHLSYRAELYPGASHGPTPPSARIAKRTSRITIPMTTCALRLAETDPIEAFRYGLNCLEAQLARNSSWTL
jgi:hypothetical protein